VGTDSDWAEIALGDWHTLGRKTNSTLWAWGRNNYGQLGLGDTGRKIIPSQIGSGTNWSTVTAGYNHTLAIKTNGTIWSWGQNNYGQLGLGDNTNRTTPTQVTMATDWSSISAGGYHSLGLKSTGRLWAWGYNFYGQLGLGNTINRNIPCWLGTLSTPSSLTATVISSSQIDLTWTNVYGENGYKIERKITAGGTYEQIATVNADITLYPDTVLTQATTFYYRVRGWNTGGNTDYSPEASATTPTGPPGAPTLLSAVPISTTQIYLFWTDVGGEIDYKIERSFGAPGAYVQIATVDANVTLYSDTTVTPSNTYYYRIRGWNPLGDGPYSNEVSAIYTPPLRPLSGDTPPTQSMPSANATAGYRFSPDVNGYIVGLGRYIGSGTGNTTVILWDDSGIELARVTVSSNSGWQWTTLSTPINISAGKSEDADPTEKIKEQVFLSDRIDRNTLTLVGE